MDGMVGGEMKTLFGLFFVYVGIRIYAWGLRFLPPETRREFEDTMIDAVLSKRAK